MQPQCALRIQYTWVIDIVTRLKVCRKKTKTARFFNGILNNKQIAFTYTYLSPLVIS